MGDLGCGRDDDDLRARAVLVELNFPHGDRSTQAVQVRHRQIGQNDVEDLLVEEIDGDLSVFRLPPLDAGLLTQRGEESECDRRVVNAQHAQLVGRGQR